MAAGSNKDPQPPPWQRRCQSTLTADKTSGDEDNYKKKKVKFRGKKSNPALGQQWWWQPDTSWKENTRMTGMSNLTMN